MKKGWASGFVLLIAALLQGCQADGAASATPPMAAETALATPSPGNGSFTNPVLDRDFPDPDVLAIDGAYYAYATNSETTNIQAARSSDLVHWTMLPDALPELPEWAVQDFGWAWAPEVFYHPASQSYHMFFTARFPIGKGGTQCIGSAASSQPEGPFQPVGEAPAICQTGEGGSIDPAFFLDDDGQTYLLWKNDGNSAGGTTWIYIQKLAADGLSLEGEATRLIEADQIWEGVLVEAPTLWKKDGRYYLFYSANAYNDRRYAVGVAVAEQVLGPYTKEEEPFLETDIPAGLVGPGGQDIVIGPRGGEWVLFHGWAGGGYRRLYLAPIEWKDGEPAPDIEAKKPIPMP